MLLNSSSFFKSQKSFIIWTLVVVAVAKIWPQTFARVLKHWLNLAFSFASGRIQLSLQACKKFMI